MTQTNTTRRPRRAAVEASLGLLAALLTVLSAYLGLQTVLISSARDDAQTTVSDRDAQLTDLNSRVTALEDVNRRLGDENSELRTQLGLPAPQGEPLAPDDATVRRSGQVTVAAQGDNLDLDAPKSESQWSGPYRDLGYDGRAIQFLAGKFLPLGSTQASYERCDAETGYRSGRATSLEIGTVTAGDHVCVLTNENRVGALSEF
ncbi:hypothetical protein GCM10009613_15180 [Pseudonocardia kongjuensis]|uniref:Uncharacterized protein n=1 Tax=Pseudonocardia kongjuensis TaxID=102227 RepID=A0ABP4IC37_9PSEU